MLISTPERKKKNKKNTTVETIYVDFIVVESINFHKIPI